MAQANQANTLNEQGGSITDTDQHPTTMPANGTKFPNNISQTRDTTLTSFQDDATYDDVNSTVGEGPAWLTKALVRLEDSCSGKRAQLEAEVAGVKSAQEDGFEVVVKIEEEVEEVRAEQAKQKIKAQEDLYKTREFLVTLGENQ